MNRNLLIKSCLLLTFALFEKTVSAQTVPADGVYSGMVTTISGAPALKITNTGNATNYRALVQPGSNSTSKKITFIITGGGGYQKIPKSDYYKTNPWHDPQGILIGMTLTPIEVDFRTKTCITPAGHGFNGLAPTPWLGYEIGTGESVMKNYMVPAGQLVPNSFKVALKSFEWKTVLQEVHIIDSFSFDKSSTSTVKFTWISALPPSTR